MLYRKVGCALILLCFGVTAAATTAAVLVFNAYDRSEEAYADAKNREMRQQMDNLWDDFRKITKTLGFNVLILPKDQNLSDFYGRDYAQRCMPETYGQTLIDAGIVTVEHVAPSLIVKTRWPEEKRSIIVCGTGGELARGAVSSARSPLVQSVSPGCAVVGYELAKDCGISPGRPVRFMGRTFRVSACQPRRGNHDDITLWLNLKETQIMLGKRGLINAIYALECRCAADKTFPNIAKIRSDLERTLPNTQVVEYMSEVVTRAEARYEAEQDARQTTEREISLRVARRFDRMRTASWILAGMILGSALGTGLLMLANARQRRHEIGVLRAIGMSKRVIVRLFLAKAGLCGFVGGMAGFLAGWPIGYGLSKAVFGGTAWAGRFDATLLFWICLISTGAAVGAGWLPAIEASSLDPALVMQEDQ